MINIKTKKEWEIYEKGFDDCFYSVVSACLIGVIGLTFAHRLIIECDKNLTN